MPPSNKIVATIDAEGVEQLQPTALDSEETTTTGTCSKGYVMVYIHVHVMGLYLSHIPTCDHLTKTGYVVTPATP